MQIILNDQGYIESYALIGGLVDGIEIEAPDELLEDFKQHPEAYKLEDGVLVLLCMMVIDYVTGMVKAYMTAQLSSRIGIKGILKKLCYMAMVAVGAGVDYLLRGALVQAGIDLHIKLFCGLLVAIWLIINELISILENLATIGVPGFPRLSKLLERLKNTVSKGDNADEK